MGLDETMRLIAIGRRQIMGARKDIDRAAAQLDMLEAKTVKKVLCSPGERVMKEAHVAAHRNGLRLSQLFETCRQREIAWPRQEAWLAAHNAGVKYTQIAQVFGVDHTTVISGVKAARARHYG